MADWTFEFHSNVSDVLAHKAAATARALEKMGGRAETHAKEICPVGTPESTGIPGYIGGTLKNSITHKKQDSETMLVGTNVQYAPYVEL